MSARVATVSLVAILLLFAATGFNAVGGGPALDSSALGGVSFRFTGNDEQRSYLGVSSSETHLSLSEIKAERLIIVVFNAFCAICQADAPVLNSVHDVIEGDTRLRGKTKLLGIATGNTDTEVAQFQLKYQVAFPLVADPEFDLERAVPENLRTPMIIIAKNVDGRPLEVLRTHLGAVARVADLLTEPVASARIDEAYVRSPRD